MKIAPHYIAEPLANRWIVAWAASRCTVNPSARRRTAQLVAKRDIPVCHIVTFYCTAATNRAEAEDPGKTQIVKPLHADWIEKPKTMLLALPADWNHRLMMNRTNLAAQSKSPREIAAKSMMTSRRDSRSCRMLGKRLRLIADSAPDLCNPRSFEGWCRSSISFR